MRISLLGLIFIFAALVAASPSLAADRLEKGAPAPIVLGDVEAAYSLVEHGRFVLDTEKRWTPENVDGLRQAAWQTVEPATADSVRETGRFWLVATVQNATDQTRWMVSMLVPDLEEVALVVEHEPVVEDEQALAGPENTRTVTRTGQKMGQRFLYPVVGHPQPLEIAAGATKTLYLLVDAHAEPGADPAEMVLRSQSNWAERAFQLTGFVMLCLGVMAALCLFFLIIWIRFREPNYLWFGLFSGATWLLWATAYDVLQLFSGQAWDNSLLNFGANASSLVFCALFGRAFLDIPWLSKRLDRIFWVFVGLTSSLLLAMFVMPQALTYTLNALAALVLWVLLVVAAVYALFRGNRDARLFLAAWGVFLVSAFLTIIEGLGASLPTIQVRLSTIGTTALGMLLMGLAVGHQLRRLHQEKRSAEESARTDVLTGLGNRTAFEADFRTAAAGYNAGRYEEVVIAFMDLDGLKGINDARGHETGDNLLRTFADLLEREFRDADRAYRLGGDEFVLLLPAKSVPEKGEYRWLKRRLEGAIVELRKSGYPEADASYGLASLSETGGNRRETLSRADARMYKNKRRKRI